MEKRKKKTVRTMLLMAFMSAGATAAAMTGSAHAESTLSRSLSDGKASFQMANVVSASGFTAKSGTVYFLKESEISKTPDMNTPAGTADKFASARLTGVSDRAVWRISSGGSEYYVRAENVTDDKNALDKKIKEEKEAEAAKKKAEAEKNRQVLNRAVSEEKTQAYSNYQKKIEEKQKQKEKEEAEKKKAIEEAERKNRLAARAGSLAEAQKASASSQTPGTSERFRNAPSNAEKIWVYLTEHGVSDTVAAAALGNIQAESSFNPRATDGGTGLIQWTSARAARLHAYAGVSGMWTIEGQMSYLLHEFATSESGAYARIKAAGSPSAAAYAWDRYYERSAGLSTSTRMRNAVRWYNTFHTSGN